MREEAKGLRTLTLTGRELNDLALIGMGACSPLTGFMTRKDYEPVVTSMRLANALPWSIPVVLAVDKEAAPSLGTRAALYDGEGSLRGIIEVEDVFEYGRLREARNVYRTDDEKHPGVAALFERKNVLVGGPVRCCRPSAIRRVFHRPKPAPSSNAAVGIPS